MIREIRTFYGLSQDVMAGFLGITRSQLSMVEIGEREMDPQKLVILLPLYKAMEAINGEPAGKAMSAINTEEEQQAILTKISHKEYELTAIQQSLDKLNNNRLKAEKILASLALLKDTAEAHDNGLLLIIKSGADKLSKKTGDKPRLKLERQQRAIEAETALLKNKLY